MPGYRDRSRGNRERSDRVRRAIHLAPKRGPIKPRPPQGFAQAPRFSWRSGSEPGPEPVPERRSAWPNPGEAGPRLGEMDPVVTSQQPECQVVALGSALEMLTDPPPGRRRKPRAML